RTRAARRLTRRQPERVLVCEATLDVTLARDPCVLGDDTPGVGELQARRLRVERPAEEPTGDRRRIVLARDQRRRRRSPVERDVREAHVARTRVDVLADLRD